MPRLTKRDVDAMSHTGTGSLLAWDGELRGFGVRAFSSGSKKFIVQYRTRTGQQRRMTLGAYGPLTVERARELARTVLGKVAEGLDPAGSLKERREAITVSELCDLYLSAADAGLLMGRKGMPKKVSTLYTDRGRMERHIKPLLGKRKVEDVRQPDIEAFKVAVALGKTAVDEKTGRFGRAIVTGGRGTATRTIGLLGSIFQWAVANGHAAENPVRGVKRFADGQKKALLSLEQYRALGMALDDLASRRTIKGGFAHHQYGLACIWFIALSGFRRGEAETLRWADIDFDGRTIRLGDTKTGESLRPLTQPLVDLLRNLERIGDYVFASRPDGPPYSGLPKLWKIIQNAVTEQARAINSPISIDDLTPHSMRHSLAGIAEEHGASLPTIAVLLGHRLGGVTAGYVLKRLDKPLIAFADRVAGSIDAAMRGRAPAANVISMNATAA